MPWLLDGPMTSGNTHPAAYSFTTATPYFTVSRKKEIKGLLKNGTFVPISISDAPFGTRILGSLFVDELKQIEQGFQPKSRLVPQDFRDEKETSMETKTPTVK